MIGGDPSAAVDDGDARDATQPPPSRGSGRLRVAILGTRGVPARYGGFETFAEELGARLAARGHSVTVYARDHSVRAGTTSHRGMRIVRLPAPRSKYLETVVHTLLSAAHVLPGTYDLVYICNVANVPAAALLRLFRRRVVLNVDGLEWQRAKWGPLGRAYYRACAWVAARLPIQIVTDARVIQDHYRQSYGRDTRYVAYGSVGGPTPDDGTLARLGLEAGRYVLYVSRLEPENNAHVVVAAYAGVTGILPLAMVGDAPYASRYIQNLTHGSDPRVRFLGGLYGQTYRVLLSNAAAYVQATEVGGTHPALVEAMGAGNAIVANDVPEHREVLADAGIFYHSPGQLRVALQELLDDPLRGAVLRQRAMARALQHYSWDAVTDEYEGWFQELRCLYSGA